MAKTKKEMRKMMGNYVDIILRRNKHIKKQEEQLQAWHEVNKVNQALGMFGMEAVPGRTEARDE